MSYSVYKLKDYYGNVFYPIIIDTDDSTTGVRHFGTHEDLIDIVSNYFVNCVTGIGGDLYTDHTFGKSNKAIEAGYHVGGYLNASNNYQNRTIGQVEDDGTIYEGTQWFNSSDASTICFGACPLYLKFPDGTIHAVYAIQSYMSFSLGAKSNTFNFAFSTIATGYPSQVKVGKVNLLSTSSALSNTTLNFYGDVLRIDDSFAQWIVGNLEPIDRNDPSGNIPNSSGGGGGGSDDIGGDEHATGTLPTISALDSGLITLYNPTVDELQSLGKFLWSDNFDISSFKKLFNDPFDTLLGLSIVPVKPTVSGTHNIIFGNMDSGVSSSVVASQWVSVDCGSFNLNEVWNGALDYAPSTQVSIYLPFIGVRQLNTNDVMGSTLHLYYRFDVLTGSCVAEITINHTSQGNKDNGVSYGANMGSVYTFEGQCAVNIPLASQDFTNTIRAAISGVAVATGAAAACATGNPALGMASLAIGMANTGIQASTPTVERSGHLSSSSALLSSLEPCLFVNRPHMCKPSRYYALRGVPSQVYVSKLSSATGFFQIADVQNIHASGASDSELDEIKSLLTQGVFVDSWS